MPGPALEPSKILPNCLVIGDSVSIGYVGIAAIELSNICQLQHAPFDVSGGGADSTQYGQACLDNFLKTQRQTIFEWDVILFNFGLHNLNDNSTSIYQQQLSNITKRLVTSTSTKQSKLIYATTTPYMPYASVGNHIVSELNSIALDIIRPYNNINVLDLHKLVTDHWYVHACFGWKRSRWSGVELFAPIGSFSRMKPGISPIVVSALFVSTASLAVGSCTRIAIGV
jgi:hypothetical protein